MAIVFLCTRVTKAMVQDRKKLSRVLLGYLLKTKEWVLTLTPEDLKHVEVAFLVAKL